MGDWLKQLDLALSNAASVMLISVLRVSGSAPRLPGAKMIVDKHNQRGTIGGGNLEYTAVRLARSRLADDLTAPHCEVMSLGPALGQCCGGRVELLFESISSANSPHALWPRPAAVRRAIAGTEISRFTPVSSSQLMRHFIEQDAAQTFLTESLPTSNPPVWVFGGGHVGCALVSQLALLPCDVVWLDEREDIFPESIPPDIRVIAEDDVLSSLQHAPADACFIIMTHSHQLDFELCRAVLVRNFSFLGLIGSNTKRATFSARLSKRGFNDALIEQIVCPLGNGDIKSNHPYAIALSVAIQLLEHWQLLEHPRQNVETRVD